MENEIDLAYENFPKQQKLGCQDVFLVITPILKNSRCPF